MVRKSKTNQIKPNSPWSASGHGENAIAAILTKLSRLNRPIPKIKEFVFIFPNSRSHRAHSRIGQYFKDLSKFIWNAIYVTFVHLSNSANGQYIHGHSGLFKTGCSGLDESSVFQLNLLIYKIHGLTLPWGQYSNGQNSLFRYRPFWPKPQTDVSIFKS